MRKLCQMVECCQCQTKHKNVVCVELVFEQLTLESRGLSLRDFRIVTGDLKGHSMIQRSNIVFKLY